MATTNITLPGGINISVQEDQSVVQSNDSGRSQSPASGSRDNRRRNYARRNPVQHDNGNAFIANLEKRWNPANDEGSFGETFGELQTEKVRAARTGEKTAPIVMEVAEVMTAPAQGDYPAMPIYSGGMQEREQTTELAKSPAFRTCRLVIGPVANSNSKSGHTVCNGERQDLLDLYVQPGQWLSVQTRNRLNFAAGPGKIAKSLRNIVSSKVDGSFHPEPSYWPEIKIDRNFSLRCHSVDIGNDGSGCIKLSAAYRLMKRGAARHFIHRGLLMLYFVPFAADHSGKGQYGVLPDADFPTTDSEGNPRPAGTNLVIAADNFNDRVRCPHSAITALFPIYPAQFQEVPPLYTGAPAHMMENLRKLVDGNRIAANARRIAFEIAKAPVYPC